MDGRVRRPARSKRTAGTRRTANERKTVGVVDRMFRALADRTRLRILHLLKEQGELCVGDIVAVLRAPQARVSRHLAYLRRTGLVQVRKDGLWKHYSLTGPRSRFHRGLLECLGGCFDEVRELAVDRGRYRRLRQRCCPA
jgi:ArsR family transcriptional regulator